MTILALEFSSSQRSVAVARENSAPVEVVETGGRGTNAFGMIEKVLAEAKIGREEIGEIAVGLGPGSYTGIRSAIAIAQGWQLAREIKLIGVSSANCLAARAQSEKIFGRVNVVIDAQRNEFYLAAYEISGEGVKEIEPLRIAAMEEIQSRAEKEMCVGPQTAGWISNGRMLFPKAMTLISLASRSDHFLPGEKLEPIYLREPDFVKTAPGRTPIQ